MNLTKGQKIKVEELPARRSSLCPPSDTLGEITTKTIKRIEIDRIGRRVVYLEEELGKFSVSFLTISREAHDDLTGNNEPRAYRVLG